MPQFTLFFTPQALSAEQMESAYNDFDLLLVDKTQTEEVFRSLNQYFFDAHFDAEIIAQYYHTYWKWYVQTFFQVMLQLAPDEVLVVLEKQLPKAFSLEFDVKDRLLYYLNRRCATDAEQDAFFAAFKKNVLNSSALINPILNKQLSIKVVVDTCNRMVEREDAKMEQAEFLGKIEDLLFRGVEYLSTVRKTQIVDDFIRFIFFLQNETDIVETVYKYLDDMEDIEDPKAALSEQKYDDLLVQQALETQLMKNIVPDAERVGSTEQTDLPEGERNELNLDDSTLVSPVPNFPPEKPQLDAEPEITPLKTTRPANVTLRNMVEAVFPPGPDGEIEDTVGAIKMLDALSHRYEDPSIADIYFYNEEAGNFQWKE